MMIHRYPEMTYKHRRWLLTGSYRAQMFTKPYNIESKTAVAFIQRETPCVADEKKSLTRIPRAVKFLRSAELHSAAVAPQWSLKIKPRGAFERRRVRPMSARTDTKLRPLTNLF